MAGRSGLRYSAGFAAALLAAGLAAGQPVERDRVSAPATPPKLRLGEVQDVAPVRYRAELTLDPAKESFSGSVQIALAIHKPLTVLWLNASKIGIEGVELKTAAGSQSAQTIPGGDDFVGLRFPAPLAAGTGELTIQYTGRLRQPGTGVFRVQDKGEQYLLTQFEATGARDAFPCFDEPSYKTPWQLTLRIPAGDRAVSNTPVESETASGAIRTVVFKETKPLPSYLVAFGVGPWEFVDAGHAGVNHVPVRIVVPKGRTQEARYAAEITATILTRLEDYFGIPYPYEKADQVSVPMSGGFGAMENAGMVTYEQPLLLADPKADSLARQRECASVEAHELAHQWFGDLVTMAWWNDVWLNEAFATWMQQKLIAEWKPEWRQPSDTVESKLGAEEADSLTSARQIRQPIETKGDIQNAFDSITYDKGAAVIGMFEHWMGPDVYRKGVHAYLKKYAFGNATSDDFLAELDAAGGKQVGKAFHTFLDQSGVPLISVAMRCSGGTPALELEQTRYVPLGLKAPQQQTWEAPVCVRYKGGDAAGECTLFTQPKTEWRLAKAASCPAWVEANADAKGYYRVDYRGDLSSRLASRAESELSAPERLDFIGNALALLDAGRMPAGDALSLVGTFHEDPERNVVGNALGLAISPYPNEVPASLEPNFQRFIQRNFQARARALGWMPHPGESEDTLLLRPELLADVATYGGDKELASEAKTLAGKWLENRSAAPPEIAAAVLRVSAWYGDRALAERYMTALVATSDRLDQQRLLGAMGWFRDPAAVGAIEQALLTGKIPFLEGFGLLFAGAYGEQTRAMPFDFVKAHFEQIMKEHPTLFGNSVAPYLARVGDPLCDAKSRTQYTAFFGPLGEKYEGLQRATAETLDTMDKCIAVRTANEAGVAQFLKRY
jgi:alanyl aminopeptidase